MDWFEMLRRSEPDFTAEDIQAVVAWLRAGDASWKAAMLLSRRAVPFPVGSVLERIWLAEWYGRQGWKWGVSDADGV